MNILIDALILGIMALCCIAGYKNGFVKTVISFLKNIVALVVAGFYSAKLGQFFYDKFLRTLLLIKLQTGLVRIPRKILT